MYTNKHCQAILEGVEEVAANSLTLAVETADLPGFDSYLEAKRPDTYTKNPWFKEFYEVRRFVYYYNWEMFSVENDMLIIHY